MSAPEQQGPDAWLVSVAAPDELWAAGTIVGLDRVLVHAPSELLEQPVDGLALLTGTDGQEETLAGAVPEITLLGDGLTPGYVFAILRVEGTRLRPRPDIIDRILLAQFRDPLPVDAAGVGRPAHPPPVSLPRRGPATAGPALVVDRRRDEVGRPWYCRIMPWLCHPTGPDEGPGGPGRPGPSVTDPGVSSPLGP
jgi:hypothetical protein